MEKHIGIDWSTIESSRMLGLLFKNGDKNAFELAVQYLEKHLTRLEELESYIPEKDITSFIGEEYLSAVAMFKAKYYMFRKHAVRGLGIVEHIFVDHINRRLIPVNINHIREMLEFKLKINPSLKKLIDKQVIEFNNNVLTFNWRYYYWQLYVEDKLCIDTDEYERKTHGRNDVYVTHKLEYQDFVMKFYLTNNTIIKQD